MREYADLRKSVTQPDVKRKQRESHIEVDIWDTRQQKSHSNERRVNKNGGADGDFSNGEFEGIFKLCKSCEPPTHVKSHSKKFSNTIFLSLPMGLITLFVR